MYQDADQNTQGGDDRADEIAQLRERLAFYESFDRLIQDNISRAGDLLREAAAKKSEGELALRSNTAEFEKQQLAERVNYRRVFSGLLDEVTTVQQNVERLARQVADALDDLEAVIPAQGELNALENDSFPSMPTFSQGIAGELNAGNDAHEAVADPADVELGEPESLEPVDEVVTADEAVQETTDFGTVPSFGGSPGFQEVIQASVDRVSEELGTADGSEIPVHESTGISVDISAEDGSYVIESLDGVEDDEPYTYESTGIDSADIAIELGADDVEGSTVAPDEERSNLQSEREAYEDSVIEDWSDDGPTTATTLLVHGVPRATTALSLKRYLEGLEQVHAVEPREYAEGVLRLQVSSDRPVGITDLLGWPEAEGMEPVVVRDDFVEVRLGH